MSEESKKIVKEAKDFFKQVEQGAEKYKAIPDKKLGDKIKKVQESAGEIVKHISDNTDH